MASPHVHQYNPQHQHDEHYHSHHSSSSASRDSASRSRSSSSSSGQTSESYQTSSQEAAVQYRANDGSLQYFPQHSHPTIAMVSPEQYAIAYEAASESPSHNMWVVTGSASASRRMSEGTAQQQMHMVQDHHHLGTVETRSTGMVSPPGGVIANYYQPTVAAHAREFSPSVMTHPTSVIGANAYAGESVRVMHATPPTTYTTPASDILTSPPITHAAAPLHTTTAAYATQPTTYSARGVPSTYTQTIPTKTQTSPHTTVSTAYNTPQALPTTSPYITTQPAPIQGSTHVYVNPVSAVQRKRSSSFPAAPHAIPQVSARTSPSTYVAGVSPYTTPYPQGGKQLHSFTSPQELSGVYPRQFLASPIADMMVVSRGAEQLSESTTEGSKTYSQRYTTDTTSHGFSSDTQNWSTKEKWIHAYRTGPTAVPNHIQIHHPAFPQGQIPSPFTLYYFDETAPNRVLLQNDVQQMQLSRALKKTANCGHCTRRDTYAAGSIIESGNAFVDPEHASSSETPTHAYRGAAVSSSETSTSRDAERSYTSSSGVLEARPIAHRNTTYSTSMATMPVKERPGMCCGAGGGPHRHSTAPSQRLLTSITGKDPHGSTIEEDSSASTSASSPTGTTGESSSISSSSAEHVSVGQRAVSRSTVSRTVTAPQKKAARGACCGRCDDSASVSRDRSMTTYTTESSSEATSSSGTSVSSSSVASTSVHLHQVVKRADVQPYVTVQHNVPTKVSHHHQKPRSASVAAVDLISPSTLTIAGTGQEQLASIVAQVRRDVPQEPRRHAPADVFATKGGSVHSVQPVFSPEATSACHAFYVAAPYQPEVRSVSPPQQQQRKHRSASPKPQQQVLQRERSVSVSSESSSASTSSTSSSTSSVSRSITKHSVMLPQRKKQQGGGCCGRDESATRSAVHAHLSHRSASRTHRSASRTHRSASRSKPALSHRSASRTHRSASRTHRSASRSHPALSHRSARSRSRHRSVSRPSVAHASVSHRSVSQVVANRGSQIVVPQTKKTGGGCCGRGRTLSQETMERDFSFGTQTGHREVTGHSVSSASTTTSSGELEVVQVPAERHYQEVVQHDKAVSASSTSSTSTSSSSGTSTDRMLSRRSQATTAVRQLSVDEPTGCCGGTRKKQPQQPIRPSTVSMHSRRSSLASRRSRSASGRSKSATARSRGGSRSRTGSRPATSRSRAATSRSRAATSRSRPQSRQISSRRLTSTGVASVSSARCCGGKQRKATPAPPAPVAPASVISRLASIVSSASSYSTSSGTSRSGTSSSSASSSGLTSSVLSRSISVMDDTRGCCGGQKRKAPPMASPRTASHTASHAPRAVTASHAGTTSRAVTASQAGTASRFATAPSGSQARRGTTHSTSLTSARVLSRSESMDAGCCGVQRKVPKTADIKRYSTSSSVSSYMFSHSDRSGGTSQRSHLAPVDENHPSSFHKQSGSAMSGTATSATSSTSTSERLESAAESARMQSRHMSDITSISRSVVRAPGGCCQAQQPPRNVNYDRRKYFFEADKCAEGKHGRQYRMMPQYTTSYKNYPTVCYDVLTPHNWDDFLRHRLSPTFAQ